MVSRTWILSIGAVIVTISKLICMRSTWTVFTSLPTNLHMNTTNCFSSSHSFLAYHLRRCGNIVHGQLYWHVMTLAVLYCQIRVDHGWRETKERLFLTLQKVIKYLAVTIKKKPWTYNFVRCILFVVSV